MLTRAEEDELGHLVAHGMIVSALGQDVRKADFWPRLEELFGRSILEGRESEQARPFGGLLPRAARSASTDRPAASSWRRGN